VVPRSSSFGEVDSSVVKWILIPGLLVGALVQSSARAASQQPVGSIRGVVYDKDFDTPLAAVQVLTVETGAKVLTTDQGNYVFSQIPPGKYTLVFSKDGYARQVKADVVVVAGQLTDVDATLAGEFTDMDEFVVQDILTGGAGTEASLMKLRFDSPSLMDSISADLMSRAGAGDAASALRLVSGASVAGGKFAVIRGLPDRYVSSQMNGVRLPTADENKRAVELDQFPAAVIESIQVSKTFTPDQQGDASGGAVNLRLKGIPDETIIQFNGQLSYNSQVASRNDFLTYHGGGVSFWGRDNGDRDIQFDNLGGNWDGAVGVSRGEAPHDYKWSTALGGKLYADQDVKIGGFASFFYERDSSYYEDGQDNSYWVTTPGAGLTPHTYQGTPSQGDFKTALYDVTKASQLVKWGGLGTLGLETENHQLGFTYLYTRSAEDKATLAEDTRGKAYYFPGYDPNNSMGPGNTPDTVGAAPYIRTETLEYTERTTQTVQLSGRHKLPFEGFALGETLKFKKPVFDWTLAQSTAGLNQPDKRQFGGLWHAASYNPGFPPFGIPPSTTPPTWYPYKPADNFNLGNVQRIWKEIDEESNQYSLNLKFPFDQWDGKEGYLKVGAFQDHVTRKFNQDTFSNFGDAGATFAGGFDDFWSDSFPNEDHPITASEFDVDYKGDQKISAWYSMMDLPLSTSVTLIGGARFESTKTSIVNSPEPNATWYPPGSTAPVTLNPGDADVDFEQNDVLPSIGLTVEPVQKLTLRGSYSQTVARQTFKELTPIRQQEFLGGPTFIGNPELQMSALKNYDLRADYAPYEGGLVSVSWFKKDIENPIEYVQTPGDFTFTTPVNYPKGNLNGYELELRQDMERLSSSLTGLSIGANATFIDSKVTLPADEAAGFSEPGIQAPMQTRDMTDAPDHLYNFFVNYDLTAGTQFSIFYTIQGDTLVAGAGQAYGNFVPSIYAKEFGTLNMSLSQKIGKNLKIQFQAKNLTNPEIEEVYRSEFTGSDVTRSSYTKGSEFSISIGASF
jgi:TonB-dependent receptor